MGLCSNLDDLLSYSTVKGGSAGHIILFCFSHKKFKNEVHGVQKKVAALFLLLVIDRIVAVLCRWTARGCLWSHNDMLARLLSLSIVLFSRVIFPFY